MKELTQEQIDGLREFKEAGDAMVKRINEKWEAPSEARRKALEYVKKRAEAIRVKKEWEGKK